jgi:hypothetical protein
MTAEELIGHAVAMAGLRFDHTYVTSAAGDRWDSKGRARVVGSSAEDPATLAWPGASPVPTARPGSPMV